MNQQLFDKQYVTNLESANYFGCESTGQSERTQQAYKDAWLEAMARHGWVLGESVIRHQDFDCDIDLEYQFDKDAERSLEEAHKTVARKK